MTEKISDEALHSGDVNISNANRGVHLIKEAP
eukprot:CAMPEP_0185915464 /NCGR_PEP_ID=MMETSP0924C-20121207/2426_1 /TAXON_ID=321610 /ORGANISM="Perkinsus chesapeaki, Strain ATCC PRA-65" /LENGTH=31 /DNA_ID= /DNA_START= /DNA_END= /DNA_ORIENTATION=